MSKKLLMGNEAIALGAIRAGVNFVSGYPGTPSTEVLETIAKNNNGGIYVEWSVNEKAALEVAAGAAYSGARSLVTMKQVGLNVASDPLMSLNYIGVKGGMVIVVADDPGPISSQTEQDTRRFGSFAKLPVFDPSTPEEAYVMMADAFALSEKYGTPVLFRPTTRVCHGRASVELLGDLPRKTPEGFVKNSRWVIFPRLAFENHKRIEANLVKMSDDFSDYACNSFSGSGKKGIASGGVSFSYVQEALEGVAAEYKLLKIATYPFPEKLAFEFLQGLDEVLVVEELDPVIEDALITVCGLKGISVKICGKRTGHMPNAGENTVNGVKQAIGAFLNVPLPVQTAPTSPPLPIRPPTLCAGCPHRASFFAVKEAAKSKKCVFSGDIGCYTLGNAQPLDMVDTCLCMGAGITVAQGLHRISPDTENFAFIGDSTFFHSGIAGIINAVYNQTDMIVVILDNSTTAMTGGQPHPGTAKTMMGNISEKVDIYSLVSALGVSKIIRANPFDLAAAKAAVNEVMGEKGVRVLLFQAPCIAVAQKGQSASIHADKCTGCGLCTKKLGCPAISLDGKKAKINASLCTGCGLCAQVCKAGAIEGGAK
jgi:indolepyruvate ferredoxin oxidoreductase, alpha subunit